MGWWDDTPDEDSPRIYIPGPAVDWETYPTGGTYQEVRDWNLENRDALEQSGFIVDSVGDLSDELGGGLPAGSIIPTTTDALLSGAKDGFQAIGNGVANTAAAAAEATGLPQLYSLLQLGLWAGLAYFAWRALQAARK